MRPETASCIADALLAAQRIQQTVAGIASNDFVASWQLQAIVERQFLIIGEAVVRIRELEPPVFDEIPDPTAIIRFRNLIMHVYNQIDPLRIYEIAREELPELIGILEKLVSRAEAEGL